MSTLRVVELIKLLSISFQYSFRTCISSVPPHRLHLPRKPSNWFRWTIYFVWMYCGSRHTVSAHKMIMKLRNLWFEQCSTVFFYSRRKRNDLFRGSGTNEMKTATNNCIDIFRMFLFDFIFLHYILLHISGCAKPSTLPCSVWYILTFEWRNFLRRPSVVPRERMNKMASLCRTHADLFRLTVSTSICKCHPLVH